MYNTLVYYPIYNALVFLTALMPGNDIGLAVVVLTLLVKTILAPLSHKTISTQKKMKDLEPLIAEIKETHKKDREAQAVKMMELYKEHRVNPFSGIVLMFIQIPIILALFFVFQSKIDLAADFIYSFVMKPATIGMSFLGLIDLTQKNLLLAVLVGFTQFIQVKYSLPPTVKKEKKKDGEEDSSFGSDFAEGMNFQMKYVLPIFIGFVAYGLSAVVSLYWIVNNVFTIIHEFYVRNKAGKIADELDISR
ncbi:MAG: membrane protein insertase YidC [Candidatus Vogelbacteria bacterium]|nr:membrane protein insertase YidC [Candidatus Vogelbacteria bacterium]